MSQTTFTSFDSVLSKGFTDKDAKPPNMPSVVSGFRKIGIYSEGQMRKRIRDGKTSMTFEEIHQKKEAKHFYD